MKFSSLTSLFKKLNFAHESSSATFYDDQGMFALTHEESIALQEHNDKLHDEESTAHKMADDLIAFAGANYVVNTVKDTVLSNNTDKSNLKIDETNGLFAFCDIHSEVIKLICDELNRRIEISNNSIDKTDPEQYINIQIPQSIMSDLSTDALAYVVDKSASEIRNSKEISNKVKLFAANSNEEAETLANVVKIETDQLIQAIIDSADDYMKKYAQSYKLTAYTKTKRADPFINTLNLLNEHEEIGLNIYNLAKFICITWLNMDHDPSDESMRKSIGKSLYVMSFPSQNNLFNTDNLKSGLKTKYRQVINDIVKSQGSLRSCTDAKGMRLSFEKLYDRYIVNFCDPQENQDDSSDIKSTQSEKDSSNSFTAEKKVELLPYEHALIKRYLHSVRYFSPEDYLNNFNDLCHIEWKDKLSKLFDTKESKKDKKNLWERTEEHFERKKQNESDAIEPQEREILSNLIDRVTHAGNSIDILTDAEVDQLYNFVQSRKRILCEDPKLLKEWNDLIFSNNKYEDDNFMLALTKCVLYACGCSSMYDDEEESHEALNTAFIELKLNETKDSMLNKNYVAATYFSMRFGAYLKYLEEQLPLKFFVTTPNRTLPLNKNGTLNNQLYSSFVENKENCPVLNYHQFYKNEQTDSDHKLSTKTSAESTTIKFILLHHSKDKESASKHEITWTYKVKAIPFNLASNLEQCLNFSLYELDNIEDGLKLNEKKLIVGHYQHQQYTITGKQAPLELSSPESFVNEESGGVSFDSLSNTDNLTDAICKLLDSCKKQAAIIDPYVSASTNALTDGNHQTINCIDEGSLLNQIALIEDLFSQFHDAYFLALKAMYDSALLYEQARALSDRYTLLQSAIVASMNHDNATPELRNTLKNLLRLLMKVGFAYENDSPNNVIATPFNVESMRTYTAKLERLASLITSATNGELNVSQIKMFIDSLSKDMACFDAPDTCLHSASNDTTNILFAKQEVAGYALYEYRSDVYSHNSMILPVEEYTNAILSYLSRYIDNRPYAISQCTLMIKDCCFPEILVGLFNACSNSLLLKDISLNLLIVNDDMEMTAAISKAFEQLRTSDENKYNSDNSAKRIHVTILSSKAGLQSYSSFSSYLNQHQLKFANDALDNEPCRIADLAIMLHMFDGSSTIEYDDFPVPVLADEIHILPSLVNRYNTGKKRSEQVCKFLVNQVQPLSRIQLFNSVWLCSKYADGKILQNDFYDNNKDIALQAFARLNGAAINKNALHAYLPNRIVSRDQNEHINSATKLIAAHNESLDFKLKTIHDYSEVVAFIDELQCRNLVMNSDNSKQSTSLSTSNNSAADNRRLVFYKKLKNSYLNLLVSSSANRQNTERYLRTIIENRCSGLNQQEYEDFVRAVEKDAIDISGSMLLRAENRQKHSYELMGNVMSKFIMEQILTHMRSSMNLETISALSKPLFLSLDDYQSVLTGKNTERADILCLHVVKYRNYQSTPANQTSAVEQSRVSRPYNNEYLLMISVIESKFFQQWDNVGAKHSVTQALKSLKYLSMPFLNDYADRKQYLAKFADMLSDTYQARSPNEYEDFSKIQTLIREEQIDIMFNGYSFVFAINSVNANESENDLLEAVMHPKKAKTGEQKVVQLRLQERSVSRLFEHYLKTRCHNDEGNYAGLAYSSSMDHNDLLLTNAFFEDMLKHEGMYHLKEYLDLQRPTIIKLHPHDYATNIAPSTTPKTAAQALGLNDAPQTAAQTKSAHTAAAQTAAAQTASSDDATLATQNTAAQTEAHDYANTATKALDNDTVQSNENNQSLVPEQGQLSGSQTPTQNELMTNPQLFAGYDDNCISNNNSDDLQDLSTNTSTQNDEQSKTRHDDVERHQNLEPHDAAQHQNQEHHQDVEQHKDVEPHEGEKQHLDVSHTTNIVADTNDTTNTDAGNSNANEQVKAEAQITLDEGSSLSHNNNDSYKPLPNIITTVDTSQIKDPNAGKSGSEDSDNSESKGKNRKQMMDMFFKEHRQVQAFLESSSATVDFEDPKIIALLDEFIEKLIKKLNKGNITVRRKRITNSGGYVELSGDESLTTKSINALYEYMLTQHGFEITEVTAISKAIAVRVKFSGVDNLVIPYEALLKDREFNFDTYTLDGVEYLGFNSRFMLGIKDDDGTQMYLDLRRDAPHTLIAGGTGSGKSTLMKMLIMDILMTNMPQDLQLILIDPKDGVEFSSFKDMPHVGPDDFPSPEQYQECFNSLVAQMESRYKYMSMFRQLLSKDLGDNVPPITDIDQYNKHMAAYLDKCIHDKNMSYPENMPHRLKHIIMVIDEFADITITEGKNSAIETMITRLGNKARAAGIHMILATQRPTVKSIDGAIKANTGNRICLKVDSGTELRIALGDRGSFTAANITGKGHMIAKLGGDMYMVQGAYMSDSCLVALRRAIVNDYELRKAASTNQ
ncbi:MAG: FtsK/SpoIIIE domain-containing protein [Anaerobiospirillum succiniciproducens]|uniref:FtsK/SpoIIIE domain-containing protein n=1 Tax=Anaerobiospirillum succiniciproducens TaxID=13335 RepID=UPI0026DB270C|nr:FtsK/SpoIIIE domain-containing protein [Anaerobiospirillum succiniciproducens]MDO4676422.1 FtsK/SpoIIIE domain-containing protein [Anaerobiospirillum succiniciproducens]